MVRNTAATEPQKLFRHAASDIDEGVAALLDALVDPQESIAAAVLATADGLPVASVAASDLSSSRLSAMSSALIGLCDATAGESQIGTCNDVIIEASAGRLLAMSVSYRGAPCVLMAVGMPRRHSGMCCGPHASARRRSVTCHDANTGLMDPDNRFRRP